MTLRELRQVALDALAAELNSSMVQHERCSVALNILQLSYYEPIYDSTLSTIPDPPVKQDA